MKIGFLKEFIDDNKCMQVNANQKWRVGFKCVSYGFLKCVSVLYSSTQNKTLNVGLNVSLPQFYIK